MKMRCVLITILLPGIALSVFGAEPAKDWTPVKQTNGVAIYSRPHSGSHLREFKAVGEIDAAPKTVHNVLDDVEAYSSFMPYTKECRVLQRNHNFILSYQRVSPKIVSDRDYTLRIQQKSWAVGNGLAYLNRWEPANEHGPAQTPGVFRVTECEGSWLLEPTREGKTRATYSIFTDSGISGPALLHNTISTTGISKLFAAVRKQAKNPKYQSK